jgi:membrane-bound lytic murein transglycosylase B
MRRRRQDRPGPEAPSTENDELEAALRDMAHRFVGLADHAENDLGEPGDRDDSAGSDPDELPDPDVAPATDAPPAGTATAAPGGAKPAGPTRGSRRRRRLRRVVPAALVVAAVAVPGSGVLDGMTELMRGDSRNIGGELALGQGGFLPVQDEVPSIEQFQDPAQLEAVPVSEAPVSAPVQAVLSSAEVVEELGAAGIPEVALRAYHRAADRLGSDDPACGVRWSLLAAIGRVESNHGRFGGARLRADGYGTKAIRGIPLDGRPNVALIRDTDGGDLDGDTTFDRAVGPMQFIPSTWRSVGVDANGDGRRDPDNLFDATRGAAGYLCAGGGDLGTIDGQARAVRRYNNAYEYVQVVLRLARMYDTGRVTPLPSLPALPGPPPLPQPAPMPTSTSTPDPTRPTPTPAPGTPGTIPGRSTTTTPPTTGAPTTTTTTAPAPTTTTPPPTTAPEPDPDAPTDTTTPSTPTTTVPEPEPEPEDPPAAVGWAPAMREIVIGIIDGDKASPTTPAEPTPAGAPVCDPPVADDRAGADDDLDGNVPQPPAACTDVPAAPADDPAATGETPPLSDPATPPTT